MKVFLLEDNVALAKNIQEYLKLKWIKVDIDFDGERGLEKIQTIHYDTLVLDINLPHKDWITICKELRASGNNIPILMLTSRNTSKDVVLGLDAGADDYLGKPFDMEELISRIHALTRRNSCNKEQIVTIKNVTVNLPQRTVERNWKPVSLSTLEFNLLKYLLQNRGIPVDRKTLFEEVRWDFDDHMFSRSVDVYIGYLRKKLGKTFIETKKWFGYVIK